MMAMRVFEWHLGCRLRDDVCFTFLAFIKEGKEMFFLYRTKGPIKMNDF